MAHKVSSSLLPAGGRGSSGLGRAVPVLSEEALSRVQRCMTFLDSAVEPFSCIDSVIQTLMKHDFHELDESKPWSKPDVIKKGGKYFFTRNRSSIVAFTVGEKYQSGNRFKIIGAHSDSPNLRVKPKSKRSGSGLTQLSVETYGGGLWHTWFDRDLSLAGRVLLRQPSSTSSSSRFEHRLIKIDRPVLHIPSLCIHLRTPEEREAFKVNKEDHLVPILCEEIKSSLTPSTDSSNSSVPDAWMEGQSTELVELLAQELNCSSRDIVDFELSLFDTQKASLGGVRGEFLCSSRLDNLASCFVAMEALSDHASQGSLADDADVSVVALFDHEEVGSDSFNGAGSTLMLDTVVRVNEALSVSSESPSVSSEAYRCAVARSFVLSVDNVNMYFSSFQSPLYQRSPFSRLMPCTLTMPRNMRVAMLLSSTAGWLSRPTQIRGTPRAA